MEKYLPEMQSDDRLQSPTQVQRSFHSLTNAIGTPARPPKQRGNPLGMATGAQYKLKEHAMRLLLSRKSYTKKLLLKICIENVGVLTLN